jgi:predicted DNA-binding protein
MGRPPLKLKDPTVKTTIRLPTSLLARLKAVTGDGESAELIRELIEAEVERRERTKPKPD